MSLRRFISSIQYKFLKYHPWLCMDRPLFILGCGRSGTTIIGKSLSLHPDIAYLNEPRLLWSECYPQTDIWSTDTEKVDGTMVLTEADVDSGKSRKLKALFDFEMRRKRGRVLVEKTPVNNFRTSFLNEIFPQAKYICIFRNGVEVAKSIETVAAARGLWFGHDGYKWTQITRNAKKLGIYPELDDFPRNDYERGLLEWRISNEHLMKFLDGLSSDQYINITYSRFVNEPVGVMSEILGFIGLPESDEVNSFLRSNISRMTEEVDKESISGRDAQIAGHMLSEIG